MPLFSGPDTRLTPKEQKGVAFGRDWARNRDMPARGEAGATIFVLAWETYRQKLERRRALREEATLQAVLANTSMGYAGVKPGAPSKESEPLPQSERFADLAERLRRFDGLENQDRDLNRARDKRDFLSDRGPQSASQNRLAAKRRIPSLPSS